MTHALYLVTGPRHYRGHGTGTEFVARLDPLAEQRAVQRGDIQVLERLIPRLPDRHRLPEGWLPTDVPSHDSRGRESGLTSSGRE